jgi:hypothetical protein
VVIDKTAFARFDTNDYSVPPTFVGQTLTLAADDRIVRLLDGEAEVARHVRSYGRRQVVEDPSHRAALIERRRIGRDLRGRDRLRAVCPAVDQLMAICVTEGRLVGPSIYRLGKLLDAYGDAVFAEAVADVVARDIRDLGAVEVACEKRRRHRHLPVPVNVDMPRHIPDRDVVPHDLENYDEP